MAFVDPSTPNLADFTTYVQNQGVKTTYLPTNSPYLTWAFNAGVNTTLVPPADMPAILYVLACYNYGMHTLLMIAQDQSGQTFFADQRKAYGLLSFTAGAVITSTDNATSQTLSEPEFLKGFLVGNLSLLKTPWGREYLDYAQQYGPTVVGIS